MQKVVDALTPICEAYGLDLIVEDPQAADHPAPFAPKLLGIDGSSTIVISPECSDVDAVGAIHEIGHCLFDPIDPHAAEEGADEIDWFAWEFLCACAAGLVAEWCAGYSATEYLFRDGKTCWTLSSPAQRLQQVAEEVRAFLVGPLAPKTAALGHVDLKAGYRTICPFGDRLPPPRSPAKAHALSQALARNPRTYEINVPLPVEVAPPVEPVVR